MKEKNKTSDSIVNSYMQLEIIDLKQSNEILVSACKDALSDFKFIERVSPESNFKATMLKLEHAIKISEA